MSKGEFKRDAIAASSDCQTFYQPVIESLAISQSRPGNAILHSAA
jgi:hypothetical protein